ncbi:IS256 family transposase ISPeth3 [bioreactor metagenome]|uniref:IS256 family transposase ISPeth3 n=1 Tax=bioreactor metagenome TaxID=1076179 RepID=A0A644YBU8_9ZZZZ
MAQLHITLDTEILQKLFLTGERDEAMSKLLKMIFNEILAEQSKEQLGADPYERTESRTAYRNGSRERQLNTRVGTLNLSVPRHRNGTFSTVLFERYQRSEQALLLAMMQMVIDGVSTRKVENITEELCGKSFSKSMVSDLCKKLDPVVEQFRNRPLEKHYPFLMFDAMYLKVREEAVKSRGLLISLGVNEEGIREVLGFRVANSESEQSWGEFFQSLKKRGLTSPTLVTSDNHGGLVSALKKQFQGVTWQRCQTHFSRNLLDYTPKALQPQMKESIRDVYEATDLTSARMAKDRLLEEYETKAPRAMKLLDEAFDDITAVLILPLKYRKRLRTTNGLERLNQEVRRRERVIRIFPNQASVIRLLGALLMEHDERWSTGRKYLDMEQLEDGSLEERKVVSLV